MTSTHHVLAPLRHFPYLNLRRGPLPRAVAPAVRNRDRRRTRSIGYLASAQVDHAPRAATPSADRELGHYLYVTMVESYNEVMATMSISDARQHLPDVMETARTEAVFVQRRGRLAGVLVSPERYEQLMTALEDAEDVSAFDAAMAEEGPNIPWEQVKTDLGWE